MSMRRRPALLAASVLAASLAVAPAAAAIPGHTAGGPAPAASAAAPAADRAGGNPNSPEKLVAAISSANLERDIRAFADIAEEHGNRAAGTPGYDASVDYAVAELEKAGYDVELEEFEITYTETLRDEFTQEGPVQRELPHEVLTYSPSATAESAQLAVPTGALGCTTADWGGADLTGRIALVSRGECPFAQKSTTAAELGAEAVVIYNNADGPLNGTLGAPSDDYVGTVGITRDLGQELVAQAAAGPVTVSLDLEQLVEQRPTVNILAETRTGRDDNVVMVGAHLDGVPAGPGIHDNASGSAVTLEVARQMAKVNKTGNTVRFALWGAEEIGLLGAAHHVAELSQSELDAIAMYVNLDMVAPLDHQNTLGVLTGDFSLGAESFLQEQLERDGHEHGPAGNGGNSDYAPFVAAGIPATGLLSYHDDNYHTAQDDIENVSITSLTHSARAVANLVGTFMHDTSSVNDKCNAGKSGKPKQC